VKHLPVKLAIFVLILFALVVTAMLLWEPVKVKYYTSKLHSYKIKVRQAYAKKLLEMGAREPVFRYYTDLYDSKEVQKRIAVVYELYEIEDKGKDLLLEIFKNWCCSPAQQVKIPAGTLMLPNGSKVEIKSLWVDKYEVTFEKYYVIQKLLPTRWRHDSSGKLIPLKTPSAKLIQNPVCGPQWQEAVYYANCLGLRIPTVYEWEYIAGAGSSGKFCFGDNAGLLSEYAWHKDNSNDRPHTVGQKEPNGWGLYDVHGNVQEWGKLSKSREYTGCGGNYTSTSTECAFGAWYNIKDKLRSTPYFWTLTGFRCVRDAE
jgi:hypothetical protein